MRKRIKLNFEIEQIVEQIFVILLIVSLFFLAAMCSPIVRTRQNHLLVFTFWLVTLGLCYWKIERKRAELEGVDIRELLLETIKKNRTIIPVLLFAVVSRRMMYQQVTRGDAAIYYSKILNACRNFDFTFRSFFDNFRLAGHPTLGYTFFVSIGEFLNPGKLTGYLDANLILTIAALYCLYQLFQGYWMQTNPDRAAVYTLLVSCTPLFWGTFAYVNPDYNLIIFMLFMLYAESRKKYILMTFWLVVLCMTKETAILVVAGYFAARILYAFFHGEADWRERFRNVAKEKSTWVAVAGAFCALIYFISQGSLFAWNGMSLASLFGREEGYEGLFENVLAFRPKFIWNQLKLGAVLNFAWIAVLVIVGGAVVQAKKKKKNPERKEFFWMENTVGLIGGFLAMTLFLMLFQTAPLNRYHIFKAAVLVIFACIVYENVLRREIRLRKRVEQTVSLVLVLLLSLQTLRGLDPLSYLAFKRMDTGKMTTLMTGGDFEDMYGDPMVNNYQYTWMDEELDTMLAGVNYDHDMTVIDAGEQSKDVKAGGYGGIDLGWNKETRRREIMWGNNFSVLDEDKVEWSEEDKVVPVKVTSTRRMQQHLSETSKDAEHFYNKYIAPYDRAVVYFIEYYEEPEEEWLEYLSQYYKIGKRQETDGARGNIVYYELTLKDSDRYPEEDEEQEE